MAFTKIAEQSRIISIKTPSERIPTEASDYALPSPLSLRCIGSEDQDFLNALYADSRPELQALRSDPDTFASIIAMQQQMQYKGLTQRFPNAQYWLVLSQSEAVGRLILDWGDHDLRLVDIAIVSAAQRQGIASALLKALQQAASRCGRNMSLTVSQTNAPAQALYLSLGFKQHQDDGLFVQLFWSSTP
jgi:ribosomal protein S18 acetylase RimI-like enzyme